MKVSDRVIAAGAGLLALLLYVTTLAPTVATVFDDSLEFQLVLPTLGIAHPTGYPLYTLLGWLFTRLLPWGDAAYRANLFSAVLAAVTVGLLYVLIRTVVGARLPALVATALFAVSPLWWSQATLAEVYTLHGLFVVLLWLIAFSPALRLPWPTWGASRPGYQNLQLLALVFGFSLAHHRMTLLLVPGLALWVFWRADLLRNSASGSGATAPSTRHFSVERARPRAGTNAAARGRANSSHDDATLNFRRFLRKRLADLLRKRLDGARWRTLPLAEWPGLVLGLVIPFVLPLLLYAYIFIRGQAIPTTNGTWLNTWAAFWTHISASAYGTFFAATSTAPDPVVFLNRQFGTLAALAGLWGMFPWPLQMRRWTVLVGSFVIQVLFVLDYGAADAEVFYLPAVLLFALFVGAGLVQAQDTLAILVAQVRRAGVPLPGPYRMYRTVIQLILAAAVLQAPLSEEASARAAGRAAPLTCEQVLAVGGPPSLDVLDRSADWRTFDCAQDILSQPLEPQATLVGLLGEMTLVRYFQQTYGLRRDLQTIVADAEDARVTAVATALETGQPVYLLRSLAGLAGRYRLDAVGPLIRVANDSMALAPEPAALPAPVAMGPELAVLAAATWPVPAHEGRIQRIALTWQVRAPVDEVYQVSARLVDTAGQIVAQYDAQPVHRARPTTTWRTGERIVDVYDLALAGAAPGPLTPQIILYRLADGREIGRLNLPAIG